MCVHNSLEWLIKSFDAIKIKAKCDHSFGTMKYMNICVCGCVVDSFLLLMLHSVVVVVAAAATTVAYICMCYNMYNCCGFVIQFN